MGLFPDASGSPYEMKLIFQIEVLLCSVGRVDGQGGTPPLCPLLQQCGVLLAYYTYYYTPTTPLAYELALLGHGQALLEGEDYTFCYHGLILTALKLGLGHQRPTSKGNGNWRLGSGNPCSTWE